MCRSSVDYGWLAEQREAEQREKEPFAVHVHVPEAILDAHESMLLGDPGYLFPVRFGHLRLRARTRAEESPRW